MNYIKLQVPMEEEGEKEGHASLVDIPIMYTYTHTYMYELEIALKSAYHWQLSPRKRFANQRGSLSEAYASFRKSVWLFALLVN